MQFSGVRSYRFFYIKEALLISDNYIRSYRWLPEDEISSIF